MQTRSASVFALSGSVSENQPGTTRHSSSENPKPLIAVRTSATAALQLS